MIIPFEIIRRLCPEMKACLSQAAFSVRETTITIGLLLEKVRSRHPELFEKFFDQEDRFQDGVNPDSLSRIWVGRQDAPIQLHPGLAEIMKRAFVISAASGKDVIELSDIASALALDDNAVKELFESSNIYIKGQRIIRPLINTIWECLFINSRSRQVHRKRFHIKTQAEHSCRLSVRNGDILGGCRAAKLKITINGVSVLRIKEAEANLALPDRNVLLRSTNHLKAEIAGGKWTSVHIRLWH